MDCALIVMVLRPVTGILVEILLIVLILSVATGLPPGFPFAPILFVIIQFLLTFFIHCPTHYLVGITLGIKFTSLRLGRTSLARALPYRIAWLAAFVIVFTLKTDKDSMNRVNILRRKVMFASGAVMSTLSAFLFVFYIATKGSLAATIATSLFAAGYLAFNIIFSPATGDIRRAMSVSGSSAPLLAT